MGFLKIFSSKKPEDYEKKGDILFEKKEYGASKIEYETALNKLEEEPKDNHQLKDRLLQKIIQSKNELAYCHKQTADQLIDVESFDEAKDLLRLAIELTEDSALLDQLEGKLEEIETRQQIEIEDFSDFNLLDENIDEVDMECEDFREHIDEHFITLCEPLKDEIKNKYYSYGNNFKLGYVALNQGNFELALTKLEEAAKENNSEDSYIPLELAKAHLNLKNYEKSRSFLENFLKIHPDSLDGYHLLCETYWETEEYDLALELLLSCPSDLMGSCPIKLLEGETLLRSKKYEEAESLFDCYLKSFGWDENIARSLAITYEAQGKKEDARDLFEELIKECQGCCTRVDPFIKLRYTELCFELGEHSVKILELYLTLSHEDAINKPYYFRKISQIYASLGNENESRRYLAFANRLEGGEEEEEEEEIM